MLYIFSVNFSLILTANMTLQAREVICYTGTGTKKTFLQYTIPVTYPRTSTVPTKKSFVHVPILLIHPEPDPVRFTPFLLDQDPTLKTNLTFPNNKEISTFFL